MYLLHQVVPHSMRCANFRLFQFGKFLKLSYCFGIGTETLAAEIIQSPLSSPLLLNVVSFPLAPEVP